jgi:ABC-type dipeptide/oligopeptide/nickel transport system ATPase subunit
LIFAAQQNAPQQQHQQPAGQNRMAMMTQHMDAALHNCQQAQAALTKGLALVNQAQSAPGAQAHSSLTDAVKRLTQAQTELNSCTSEVSSMRQMHEQMRTRMQQHGGMMGPGPAGSPQAPPK